jgi:hypothetical protein
VFSHPIWGDRSHFIAGPADTDEYAISDVESCDDSEPIYRVVVTGKGSVPLDDADDPDHRRAAEWLQDGVLSLLDRWGVFWTEARYDWYWCGERRTGISISTREWAAGDEIARTIAIEMAADDLNGEIAVILENSVLCGGEN